MHDLIARDLHYHFTHEVLAVRDVGDRHDDVLRYRNQHAGTDRKPVILKASMKAWHKQGRYDSMPGKPLVDIATPAQTVARETAQADFT